VEPVFQHPVREVLQRNVPEDVFTLLGRNPFAYLAMKVALSVLAAKAYELHTEETSGMRSQ